jgi:hypothetical protein
LRLQADGAFCFAVGIRVSMAFEFLWPSRRTWAGPFPWWTLRAVSRHLRPSHRFAAHLGPGAR